MKLEGRKILIIGTGISGIAAAKLCCEKGAEVTLYDSNKSVEAEQVEEKLGDNIKVKLVTGDFPDYIFDETKLLILSPGVPIDLEFVCKFRTKGVPIWGEVELAYVYSKGKISAITGTNGKTTTTALVGAILKEHYKSVYIVGNIGIPYTQMVSQMTDDSVTAAEMSSFQLDTIVEFRPDVSAILNITPDHLDRHHTMENYIDAKKNIMKNQTETDICVLNYEDEVLREIGKTAKAKIMYFSSKRKVNNGVYLENNQIKLNCMEKEEVVCSILELKLLGIHNYENVCAAVAITYGLSVPIDTIRKVVKEFRAVEHRIEYVTEKNDVKYYNDSKGTNPDAAIKGIEAMMTPTLLIAGGYDKNSEYDEWIKSFKGKVKLLVLIGQTREKIAEAAKRNGFHNIEFADTLEDAVNICASEAKPGNSVLLSPACASWGMFDNYEQRGRIFKELVNKL